MTKGKIITQMSASRTGKTIRATIWKAGDPKRRRVVEGDRKEAKQLSEEGYDVMLNLLPGM